MRMVSSYTPSASAVVRLQPLTVFYAASFVRLPSPLSGVFRNLNIFPRRRQCRKGDWEMDGIGARRFCAQLMPAKGGCMKTG